MRQPRNRPDLPNYRAPNSIPKEYIRLGTMDLGPSGKARDHWRQRGLKGGSMSWVAALALAGLVAMPVASAGAAGAAPDLAGRLAGNTLSAVAFAARDA